MEYKDSPKRFNFQKEEFSQERVKAVKETVAELREKHSEILGLNLFGSLTKGLSREESDIDWNLLVEVDQNNKGSISKEDVVLDIFRVAPLFGPGLPTQRVEIGPGLTSSLKNYYQSLVIDSLGQKLPDLESAQLGRGIIFPINQEIIDDLIFKFAASLEELSHYSNEVFRLIPNIDSLSNVEKVKIMKEGRIPLPEQFLDPVFFLGSLFFMEVGGGIRPYRQHLLETLNNMGIMGEVIWRDKIAPFLESWEQKVLRSELPTKKSYPRTLGEALNLYGGRVDRGKV